MTLYLGLERAVGENPTEIVFRRTYRNFTLWLKNEYPGACWEWIFQDGEDVIDFGQAPDQEGAGQQLAAAVVIHCPELEDADRPNDEGILRVVARRVRGAIRYAIRGSAA